MEVSNITKNRIINYLSKGKRFDGRSNFDLREIKIEKDISKNAEGSARVKLGNTEVIAGVKLDVMEPYTDSEDSGVLITTAELLPLSSERFERGPPRIEAIELARIVDRGIRESGYTDFKKLCIKKGEKVWGVFLDIYSINDAGNLMDASCLAAITALKLAKMPKYNEKTDKVSYGELTNKKLPLTESMPLTLTFHKIGDELLLDPTMKEEAVSDVRLTIAISPLNKRPTINALQKGKEGTLSEEEISQIINKALEKYKSLYSKILKMVC